MDGVMRALEQQSGQCPLQTVGRVAGRRAAGWLALAGSLLLGSGCESGAPSAPSGSAPSGSAPSGSAPSSSAASPSAASANASNGGAVQRFGGALEPASSVPLATLLANPKAYTEQTVTTEGKVQRACSNKGCWMEIGEGPDACRVTFKDYAFFVPTDSAGSHAKVQGKLDTRQVEAAAVAHLEAEGARFNHKNADGSAVEVRMIASAVELVR